MPHRFFMPRSAGRRAIVLASAVAALAVAAPLANASSEQSQPCQASAGQWISVTDEQGVPTLELVGAIVCTNAVTGQACTFASQRGPSGWVEVTDETGVPWLYATGFEPASSSCGRTTAAVSAAVGSTAEASTAASPLSTLPPMKSPYPGWVVVFDDAGVPTLEPISQIR
jgi:hypothetical protein